MAVPPRIVEVRYRAMGAAASLFRCHGAEVLIEGPAGTGKTRAVCEKLNWLAEVHGGCRILMCRKTRASMTESVLVTWERDVLPEGHGSLRSGGTREHRHSYRYSNGSEVVIGGLDNPDRIMSTEYDVIAFFEATETTLDDWDKANSRLRNHRIPHPEKEGAYFEQAIADCNPGHAYHWLNRRATEGRMVRLLSRHEDNPTVTADYLEKLASLSGVRRSRLYLGLWVSAEGQIWENWDPDHHVIVGELTQRVGDGRWMLHVPAWGPNTIELTWFFASVDWGFRNPGVLQVWGVSKEGVAYLVYEVYRTQRNPEWWADKAESLRRRFDIQRFVCDPAEPDSIDLFCKRMGKVGGFWIAVGADNDFLSGSNVVRERLGSDGVYLLAGVRDGTDEELVEAKRPTCLEEEIPSYVYREIKDGQPVKEEPSPTAEDHACDAFRYGMKFLDGNDWQPKEVVKSFRAGSYGALLGHEEVWQQELW